MIIQNNKISLSLQNVPAPKDAGVAGSDAKDGSVSAVKADLSKDCAPGRSKESATYTEAQARQLNTEDKDVWEATEMSPSDFINRCMTGEDAKDVADEETPLEQYTSSQVERTLRRVKSQREDQREAVDRQVAKQEEIQAQTEEDAMVHQIESQLASSGLPVVSDNVSLVMDAYGLALESQNISRSGMNFLIGGNYPLTPEQMQKSQYTGSQGPEIPVEGYEQVQEQVDSILQEAGLDVSEDNKKQARWLYEQGLPVTAENIVKMNRIQELTQLDSGTLLARITDQMADGVLPGQADLMVPSREEAAEMAEGLLTTTDEELSKVYVTEADFITAKRQLEEIRLSMTAEAARSMAARGIHLDLAHLSEVVEDLRQQEKEARQMFAEELGMDPGAAAVSQVTDTLGTVKNVLSAPAQWLADSIQTPDEKFGVLGETAAAYKEQYEKAGQIYEAVGTQVRRDLGDSLNKAFGNVNEILEDLGLETTGRNQRAVRILGYNQSEITKESVEQMKEYDDKVNAVLDRMKPQVVARLVKDQVNPLECSLDELQEKINEIYDEVVDQDISFKKYLWKLDHKGNISEEERTSMIGVFRLLDKIEKSDGALTGQVVKEGRELDLASLLSASRSKRARGMDVEISDEQGAVEAASTKGTSISDQILSAYDRSLAGQLKKNLEPDVLLSGENMSWEQALEACEEAAQGEDMSEFYSHQVQQIRQMTEAEQSGLQAFLEEMDMPATLANMAAAREFFSDSIKKYDLWQEEDSQEVLEHFDDPEALEQTYEKIEEKQADSIEKERQSDDITYDRVVTLARMAGNVSFYASVRRSQVYDVPVFTEQGITSCRVTLRSGETEKGSVEIHMQSEVLGTVDATFRVNGKRIKGFVTAQKEEALASCQRLLDKFEKDLEEYGFTMDGESLIRGSRTALHTGEYKREVKNRDLYQVAKCFITNIAGKDETEYEN